MKAIGLDIGTTGICGILVDADTGEVERKLEEENDTWITAAHSWERLQDPHAILKKVRDVLEKLLCENVAAIGVTGQMHGILYVDETGRAVSPLYTWQDGRGNQPFEGTTYARYLNSYSGYGYVTHFYNRSSHLIPEEACTFCTIQDYAVMQLTGRRSPLVHSTNAAGFGQYDVEKGCFTAEDGFLPRTVPGYAIAGHFRGIPVSAAIGDNQAGFLGAVRGKDCLLVNVGTGSQVSMAASGPVSGGNIETRPYVERDYLLVGSSLCGGRAYAMLENFFRKTLEMLTGQESARVYERMQEALAKGDGLREADLPIFDTRFMGSREDPFGRGSVRNLTPENFLPEYFAAGLLKGMAEELYEMYARMGASCGRIIGSGNGIRKNPMLREWIEDVFGAKMQIPVHREEACFGAAIFSLVAAGIYADAGRAQERMVHYTIR